MENVACNYLLGDFEGESCMHFVECETPSLVGITIKYQVATCYADHANAYWTGYFTSRPALKGFVRMMSGFYLAARQLEFLKGRNSSGPQTDTLADALAIAQHHDAVSGTEKQHVANDYAKRLYMGYAEAAELVETALACLVESNSKSGCANPAAKFEQCPLLNISYCPPSEADLSQGRSLVVVVYNSLGWKREDMIRIPIISESVTVYDSEGNEVESQLLPIANTSTGLRNYYVKAYLGVSPSHAPEFLLAFPATVPPLGFSTYIISSGKKKGPTMSALSTVYIPEAKQFNSVEVGPGNLKLVYAVNKGKLTHYSNSRSAVKASFEQSYSFYASFNGTKDDTQASGAYIFRPNGTFSLKAGQAPLTIFQGPLLHEVHQRISPWIFQVTRVFKEKEHAEIEFIVGPIPSDDGVGKEIATQIITTMNTNKTFYTDSNGRDFIKRVRDYRTDWDLQVNQPAAGNYYPINLGIYVKDDNNELSVLVDRSVGGSSLLDGQIELMLHRRLFHDDSRGVEESLNETVCVGNDCRGLTIQGKFYVRLDPLGEGAKWRRSFGQEIYSPLLLAFAQEDGDKWRSSQKLTFSAMDPSYSLPENVAIITLEELEDGRVLLRLAHLYEIGEDKKLSTLASVDLTKLFPNKKINKITEMNLSANQERAEMEKKRLVWQVEGSPNISTAVRGRPLEAATPVVELGPMEIRTFVITFEYIVL